MDVTRKITILKLISDNKSVLFGKFDNNLTFDMKINKWKEIAQTLKETGVYDKDWKYLRDTTWQNWRKRTIEKRDNRNQTGSAGGKRFKLDESDDLILNIIGKNTPVIEGLDVPESSGTQATIEIENTQLPSTNTGSTQQSSQINNNVANTIHKSIMRLKKEKLDAEILLIKEKTDIAKREKYKLDLELFKLEKELNITQPSCYTETYHEPNVIQINLVQLSETEENVHLSEVNTI